MKPSNEDIIKAFWQQGANNCASIALIKAAVSTFGVNNVFELERTEDKYWAKLKDSTEVNFSKADLELSIKVGSFQKSKDTSPEKQQMYTSIKEYAELCFAVMVAKYNIDNNINSFEKSLLSLSNGANARFVSQYLGLGKYCSEVFRGNAELSNMIAWQHMPWLKHVVYMSENKCDYYGTVFTNVDKFPKRIQLSETEILGFMDEGISFSKLNYINISKHGNFQNTGNTHTIPEEVDQIVEYIKKNNIKRLLLNIHGGLVSEEKGMDAAETFFNNYKSLPDTLPVSLVWETGFFEALPDTFKNLLSTDSLLRKLISRASNFFADRFEIDLSVLDKGLVPNSMENEAYILYSNTELLTDAELRLKFMEEYPENKFLGQDLTQQIYMELTSKMADEELQEDEQERFVRDDNAPKGFLNLGLLWHVAKVAKRCITRFIDGRGHGVLPTIVEEAFREIYMDDFGSSMWDVMKKQARIMWNPNDGLSGEEQFAGRYLIDKLKDIVELKELKIDIVAHSAGSIVTCNLVELLGRDQEYKNMTINKIFFLAPACRCELFYDTIMKYTNVYKDFKMFTMSDYYESRDNLIQLSYLEFIYTRSLLYLISGILEGREPEDADALILGLHRHLIKDKPYSNISFLNEISDFLDGDNVNGKLILSISPDTAISGRKTGALHHGGFGIDEKIVESIIYTLTQQADEII
jgi:hypothetical protein